MILNYASTMAQIQKCGQKNNEKFEQRRQLTIKWFYKHSCKVYRALFRFFTINFFQITESQNENYSIPPYSKLIHYPIFYEALKLHMFKPLNYANIMVHHLLYPNENCQMFVLFRIIFLFQMRTMSRSLSVVKLQSVYHTRLYQLAH